MEVQLPTLSINTTWWRYSGYHHLLSAGGDRVEDLLPVGELEYSHLFLQDGWVAVEMVQFFHWCLAGVGQVLPRRFHFARSLFSHCFG